MAQPVKLGVVGGHRGGAFRRALAAFQERVVLTSVCDISPEVLARWESEYPQIATYPSYDEFLDKSGCDVVYIATPLQLHTKQAIAALAAGKHVISEVIAAATLDECWRLVEAVERSGLVYMFAENYCYQRPNMMVRHMAEQGLFGELLYAEGAYIHDCRHLIFTPQGELTWRGVWRRDTPGNGYPTHSLGPLAQWLRVNRPGGDRLVRTVTWMTCQASTSRYALDRFGPNHPAAKPGFFKMGDSATTLIETAKGALIVLRVDWASARPHNMVHYVLQGTHGAYLSPRSHHEDPLIWLEGHSPGVSPGDADWEPLWNYADQYEHPRWREWGATAREAGHGGGDFFVLQDFLDAIEGKSPPTIDVYDAVTWSCISPLSVASVRGGGVPVEIPNFKQSAINRQPKAEC